MMNSNKKIILFCSPRGGTGGIAKWTEHILAYYYKLDNCSMTIDWQYPTLKSVESQPDDSLYKRLLIGLNNYIPLIKLLKNKLKNDQYDIAHFSSSASYSLIRDILCVSISHAMGVKVIIHFHFGRIPEIFKNKGWELCLLKKVLKSADAIIVMDKRSYETLCLSGFKNIYKLPNPLSESIENLINSNHVDKKGNEVLFVGHIIKTKGILELIRACNEIENIHLTLMGEGTESFIKEAKSLVKHKGYNWVNFTGMCPSDEVVKSMLSCDVFVLPSYTEGFPNVIIESMACGCPIVATDVGAIPEMLGMEDSNHCGICVKPLQVEDLREAIKRMLYDRSFAHRCGVLAQERVKKFYSMPAVWKQLTNIWAKVSDNN